MIVIRSKDFDQELSLDSNKFYSLVIENVSFYRTFYIGLKNQIESGDDYLLYEDTNDKKGSIDKDCYLIENPLNVQIDEKKINLVVQKSIGTKQPPEIRESYQVLLSKINEFINSISYDYYLPLIFDDGLTLVNFLKAINLRIADTTDNPVNQLVFKIRELSYVLGFKVFFIMNLYNYFTPNEIESIHKELNSLEIKMINISSHRNKYKINNEFIVDIDEDLAEIHIGEDE